MCFPGDDIRWMSNMNSQGGIFMEVIFSKFERKIIDKMISLDEDGHDVHLQNILADENGLLGHPAEFAFFKDEDRFLLRYSKKLVPTSQNYKDIVKETEKKLYDSVLLLESLAEKGYILLVDATSELLSTPTTSDYKQEIPLCKDLESRLYSLWNKNIKILLRLKSLKQHNYLEENIYEAKRNTRWYIRLTAITIIVSLLSICVQVILANRNETQKISIEAVEKTIPIILQTE